MRSELYIQHAAKLVTRNKLFPGGIMGNLSMVIGCLADGAQSRSLAILIVQGAWILGDRQKYHVF